LVTHHWRHGAWRAEGELLRGVAQIDHIPAVLIHGRLDLSSPPDVPSKVVHPGPQPTCTSSPTPDTPAGDAISEHVVAALDNFRAPRSVRLCPALTTDELNKVRVPDSFHAR
jgi:proline iminopeptidase